MGNRICKVGDKNIVLFLDLDVLLYYGMYFDCCLLDDCFKVFFMNKKFIFLVW